MKIKGELLAFILHFVRHNTLLINTRAHQSLTQLSPFYHSAFKTYLKTILTAQVCDFRPCYEIYMTDVLKMYTRLEERCDFKTSKETIYVRLPYIKITSLLARYHKKSNFKGRRRQLYITLFINIKLCFFQKTH